MKRAILILALTGAVAACDNGIHVLNSAPVVTAVGPIEADPAQTNQIDIHVWIHDHEGESVDLNVELVHNGATTTLDDLGGHGTYGLTSSEDPMGERHRLEWAPDGAIGGSDSLQLRFTPVDASGNEGDTFVTEPFTLSAGRAAP